jgi:hypothetical protein
MDNDLWNMGDDILSKEEDLIYCLDTSKHQEMLERAKEVSEKYDMTEYEWLMLMKLYLKYKFLYMSLFDKKRYIDNLICFLIEKTAIIDSLLSTMD